MQKEGKSSTKQLEPLVQSLVDSTSVPSVAASSRLESLSRPIRSAEQESVAPRISSRSRTTDVSNSRQTNQRPQPSSVSHDKSSCSSPPNRRRKSGSSSIVDPFFNWASPPSVIEGDSRKGVLTTPLKTQVGPAAFKQSPGSSASEYPRQASPTSVPRIFGQATQRHQDQRRQHTNSKLSNLSLRSRAKSSIVRNTKVEMGGCVSKNGTFAPSTATSTTTPTMSPTETFDEKHKMGGIISSSPKEMGTLEHPAAVNDIQEVTGELGFPTPSLKEKERRRLSLSQSDPVKVGLDVNEARGLLVIHSGSASDVKDDMTRAVEAHVTTQQEQYKVNRDHDDSGDEDEENEASFPSSDDENERGLQQHPVAARSSAHLHPGMSATATAKICRRLSVAGVPSSIKQDNFENKKQEIKSDTGYFDPNTLLGLGIGYTCKKGLKPESPNQDDFFIVRVADWGLYGVFDGHGPYGHDVSNFVQRELPKLIYNDHNFHTNPKEALRNSFVTVHQMLVEATTAHRDFDCSLSGTTATVVLHRKSKNILYVAHVGDSRCILGRLSKNGRKIEAVDLTMDHKPNNEVEKKRITLSGGQVRRLEGDIPYRVFLKGRLYPGLAMSRAIGDTVGRQAGVICEPEVSEHMVDEEKDLFFSICSDGVWEFLESSEVAQVIYSNGIQGVQLAADSLAKESWKRWIQEEGNVVDDITAEIVFLNPEKLLCSTTVGT